MVRIDREYGLTNPDGIRFDIGHDFVETIMAQHEVCERG